MIFNDLCIFWIFKNFRKFTYFRTLCAHLEARFSNIKNLDYKIEEGEAAFYGPKLDFMVKDALGRKWQLGTCKDFPSNISEHFVLPLRCLEKEVEQQVCLSTLQPHCLLQLLVCKNSHT